MEYLPLVSSNAVPLSLNDESDSPLAVGLLALLDRETVVEEEEELEDQDDDRHGYSFPSLFF